MVSQTLGSVQIGGMNEAVAKTGSSLRKAFPYALKFAEGMAFAIELVTFQLYFYEEAMVLFMRIYSREIYNKELDKIWFDQVVNFDFIFSWYVSDWKQYGILAVYSYNAISSCLYQLRAWREYGEILTGGMPSYYDFQHIGDYLADAEQVKNF